MKKSQRHPPRESVERQRTGNTNCPLLDCTAHFLSRQEFLGWRKALSARLASSSVVPDNPPKRLRQECVTTDIQDQPTDQGMHMRPGGGHQRHGVRPLASVPGVQEPDTVQRYQETSPNSTCCEVSRQSPIKPRVLPQGSAQTLEGGRSDNPLSTMGTGGTGGTTGIRIQGKHSRFRNYQLTDFFYSCQCRSEDEQILQQLCEQYKRDNPTWNCAGTTNSGPPISNTTAASTNTEACL